MGGVTYHGEEGTQGHGNSSSHLDGPQGCNLQVRVAFCV
jgi:hypothetical protein